MLRIQQLNHLENGYFAKDLATMLEPYSIRTKTRQYRYAIVPSSDPTMRVEMTATPLQNDLESLSGAVVVIQNPHTNESKTIATLCKSHQPQTNPPAMPILSNQSQLTCLEGKEFKLN
ncbi:MAG: hypothetical protein F6J87_19370 [Spirulina sp. SIO3F2]|nr:hypothetical protein [Spirulina sp. SIO3F2]